MPILGTPRKRGTRPLSRLVADQRQLNAILARTHKRRQCLHGAVKLISERRQLGPLLGGVIVPLVLRHEVADHEVKESLIVQSRLDWTIVEPPRLSNGAATGEFRHGNGIRSASLLPTLARADVAAFMLAQLDGTTYSRRVANILR
ncbi:MULTISPECIES: NAD(P)H-binding protein [unclassified Mesorhizobium]|uniref:NAD(P)H-binding protein n=1 Tax=unclassified Mesorhizobium TaxID=325217 RepID=UPI0003CEB834|nr:NAD(P)H-binding protein [Mesorhizobium sp. LSHC420B00]ESX80780.1 epimerase [Mesorhizobium sp. LSHC420B00]